MIVDLHKRIGDALAAVCPNVKMGKPEGDLELPQICYAELENTVVNEAQDHQRYGVAVYAGTYQELADIIANVDYVMVDILGTSRTGKTSDNDANAGTDLYFCRLDYSFGYNKVFDCIMRGSS